MDNTALYQEIILEHNRSPRNYGEMDGARTVKGHNPLCGDRVQLWVRFDGDRVEAITFTGEGCAISKASASMMTQAVKGKTRGEAKVLFEKFHALITGATSTPDPGLGRLQAFAGVARLPSRVKCASMAWHALHEALQPEHPVSETVTDD